jgi:hypothetical protein
MSQGQVESLLVQAAQGAMLMGGLYGGAALLCEINTFDDMQTVVMTSSAETPILLMGAVFLGYGLRTYGPPLVAVPSAAVGGAVIIGSLAATWEHAGGFVGIHNHTAEQKRKHIAALSLSGALAAVLGTTVNTLSMTGAVPMGVILTGEA